MDSSHASIRWLAVALAFPLGLAGYWSARLAWADLLYRRDTLDAARLAARLDPANARDQAWLAELEENEGHDPVPALGRALALNPRDSAVHIRLGLIDEQRGDFSAAGRELLEAARVDRQFDPRSALAQFYFRRGDAPQFWRWLRAALAVSYGDLAPLVDLAWRMDSRPEIVRAALPADHAVLAGYLRFLLATGRFEPAVSVAREVAAQSAEPDLDLLLAASDRTFDVPAWNALCGRLIPCEPLDPGRGRSLTNAGFAWAPVLHGFDWRIPAPSEVTVTRAGPPVSLSITFSGREPESCELLVQYLPLEPNRRYRFRFETDARGPGLFWRVLDAESPLERSGFDFESGRARLGRLTLVYRRPAGRARLEGRVTLRGLALGFAE